MYYIYIGICTFWPWFRVILGIGAQTSIQRQIPGKIGEDKPQSRVSEASFSMAVAFLQIYVFRTCLK